MRNSTRSKHETTNNKYINKRYLVSCVKCCNATSDILLYSYSVNISISLRDNKELSVLTMKRNGLPERLQIGFYRRTCLWGCGSAWRHHRQSWRSSGAPWWWGFTTEEADEILTSNSSPPFLYPCQDVFVPSLMTDLNTQLVAALMGINTLWK